MNGPAGERVAVKLRGRDEAVQLAHWLSLRGFSCRTTVAPGHAEVAVEEGDHPPLRVLDLLVALEEWLALQSVALIVIREGDRLYTLRSALGRVLIERAPGAVDCPPAPAHRQDRMREAAGR